MRLLYVLVCAGIMSLWIPGQWVRGQSADLVRTIREIEERHWAAFEASPKGSAAMEGVSRSKSNYRRVRAAMNARMLAAGGEYRFAVETKERAAARLEKLRFDPKVLPVERRRASAEYVRASVEVRRFEDAAAIQDPKVVNARKAVEEAEASLKTLRKEYELRVIHRDPAWVAAQKSLQDIRSQTGGMP